MSLQLYLLMLLFPYVHYKKQLSQTEKRQYCHVACHFTVSLCLSAVMVCMTDDDGFSLAACL